MQNLEWLGGCRERGRRGGLKSARVRRAKKEAREYDARQRAEMFHQFDEANGRYKGQEFTEDVEPLAPEYCPDCGEIMHLGFCSACDEAGDLLETEQVPTPPVSLGAIENLINLY